MADSLGKEISKGLLFLSIGLILLFLIYYQVNNGYQAQCVLDGIDKADCNLIGKIISDMRGVKLHWLLVMMGIYVLSNISRTYKWNMLLEPLGHKPRFLNTFGAIMIGYFTNLGFPRAGEFIRSGVITKYEGIDIEKVIGTVIIDRIMDVIMLGVFFLLACVFSWELWMSMITQIGEKSSGENGGSLILYGAIGLVMSLLFLFLFRKTVIMQRIIGRLSTAIKGLTEGLLSVSKMEKKWNFIFHSVMVWIFYYLMVVVGFWAFGPTEHLGLIPALLIFILGGMGMVIPTPGGMGSYHYLVMMGLSFYAINQAEGFSYAMIMFLCIHLFGNILFGLLSLIVLPFYNKKNA